MGYGKTAYILTQNLNMLEHIANNGMNTTMHTDANIAQFLSTPAHRPVDAPRVSYIALVGSRSSPLCGHSMSSMHAHFVFGCLSGLSSPVLSTSSSSYSSQLFLMSTPGACLRSPWEDPLCDSQLREHGHSGTMSIPLTGYEAPRDMELTDGR